MFGSAQAQKRRKRRKPPPKPAWNDPATRVTITNSVLVTIGPVGLTYYRFWLPKPDADPLVRALIYAEHRREKGGA